MTNETNDKKEKDVKKITVQGKVTVASDAGKVEVENPEVFVIQKKAEKKKWLKKDKLS